MKQEPFVVKLTPLEAQTDSDLVWGTTPDGNKIYFRKSKMVVPDPNAPWMVVVPSEHVLGFRMTGDIKCEVSPDAVDLQPLWDAMNEMLKPALLPGYAFEKVPMKTETTRDRDIKRIARTTQARVLDAGLCGAMHPRELWVCNNFRDHDDNHKVIPQGAFGAAILDAKPTQEWAKLVLL